MHGRKPKFPISQEGKLPVTKIDAAVRQLETAITLWFHDGDPVPICTLSHAAYEILYRLSAPTRKRPAIFDAAAIKPEFVEDFKSLFRSGPDFLKHAGKDPHETHFLAVKNQPAIFLDAVSMYNGMGFGMRPIFRVFQDWLWLTEPRFFIKKAQDVFGADTPVDEIIAEGRQSYFATAVPFYTARIAGVKK